MEDPEASQSMNSESTHTGMVVELCYWRGCQLASGIGDNWFRHQADSLGGSSGSGVIGADGLLVGVHTNAGCQTLW